MVAIDVGRVPTSEDNPFSKKNGCRIKCILYWPWGALPLNFGIYLHYKRYFQHNVSFPLGFSKQNDGKRLPLLFATSDGLPWEAVVPGEALLYALGGSGIPRITPQITLPCYYALGWATLYHWGEPWDRRALPKPPKTFRTTNKHNTMDIWLFACCGMCNMHLGV